MSEFVFGTHNAAFVQVMYEQFLRDPVSVPLEWRQLFENGKLAELPVILADRSEVLASGEREAVEVEAAPATAQPEPSLTAPRSPLLSPRTAPSSPLPGGLSPITGPAARLVRNMQDSLSVPTATSFREIDVKTLDVRRAALNTVLSAGPTTPDARRPSKVSYTHLIGYAIVQAARALPVMTHALREVDGEPHRFDPGAVSLGLAVDVEKKDGTHSLLVPVIKGADAMDFAAFHRTYEGLVEKARTHKLLPDNLAGGTITLTNPGTLGTVASVPRLMKGQGSIIATGAIRDTGGGGRVMTISSTYDHRIIQGAESGMFLRKLDQLLQGEDGFYDGVFDSLGVKRSGERQAVGDGTAAATASLEPSTTAPSSPLLGVAGGGWSPKRPSTSPPPWPW